MIGVVIDERGIIMTIITGQERVTTKTIGETGTGGEREVGNVGGVGIGIGEEEILLGIAGGIMDVAIAMTGKLRSQREKRLAMKLRKRKERFPLHPPCRAAPLQLRRLDADRQGRGVIRHPENGHH